jgi:hypothetical protein
VYTQLQSSANHADVKEREQQVLQHKTLVQRLERVVLVLDAALVEARLAREAMLLYIQVRACSEFTVIGMMRGWQTAGSWYHIFWHSTRTLALHSRTHQATVLLCAYLNGILCLLMCGCLQFIKDCAYDAALAENNTASGLKPDISLR